MLLGGFQDLWIVPPQCSREATPGVLLTLFLCFCGSLSKDVSSDPFDDPTSLGDRVFVEQLRLTV